MVEAIVLGIHLLVTIPVVLVALGPPSLLGAAFGVLGIIITLVFGLGLALIISSYGIRYLDLGHALESVMLFLFLFTPVFWTEASLGETRSVIVHYNPLFHFLELARAPIIKGNIPVDSLLIAVPASLLTLFVGVFIYVKRRPQIGVWMQ